MHPRPVTATSRSLILIFLVLVLLAGLPLAVWLDLRNLTERALLRQANDLNSLMTSVRGYYANNVVGRVLASPGSTQVVHNYETIPGAIPIPATLSLELGRTISEQQQNIAYRFVWDFPFQNRAPHVLDDFETGALAALRNHSDQKLTNVSWSILSDRVRLVAPVLMGAACVACHNSHPESPKRDWKIGDVRGIQEITISQAFATNIFSFKYLLAYFVFMAATGFTFITVQRRQAATIRSINGELETANEFLATLSMKISRYLSPQIYKSIFSGQKDVTIHTERKKLTIFFSDIKDFTATTERLQPEQITRLLNEYFTEMSNIALKYGGTIDKFVGDAILIFFGDPESKGEAEDAKACMRMAAEMQHRVAELNAKWRNEGVEHPFRVRMGINTGFCNVGNFGSADRMDYTIIGAEANLAARLQSVAEAGHIVVSYETYALVRDIVVAHALPPITMKGISREVIPYSVEGMLDTAGQNIKIFSEHLTGLDFYLDPSMIHAGSAGRIRALLQDAIAALENYGQSPRPDKPITQPR
ncbi:MAG TPA: adenylate/guanylate cyclase domain-containing protein [Xanthobacteraceae bacterium]|nr:adenylate/guanylate cyclase domain-containing protein [Xanthobacteraceae bacterium]